MINGHGMINHHTPRERNLGKSLGIPFEELSQYSRIRLSWIANPNDEEGFRKAL